MIVKNELLNQLIVSRSLEKLSNVESLDVELGLKIAVILKNVMDNGKPFVHVRRKLRKKYEIADGKIDPKRSDEFDKEWEELMNLDTNFDFERLTISRKDITDDKKKLVGGITPLDLMTLSVLIDFE